MREYRLRFVISLLPLVFFAGGCNILAYPFYLFAPREPKKTVEAEYDQLPGHSIAIVIYTDTKVMYEFPMAKLEMSAVIAKELKDKVRHGKKDDEVVTVIEPQRVIRYQDEHIHWHSLDRTAIGKAMKSDYVLYISIEEYSTREPGSISLLRGLIIGQASLYKVDMPEREARVWHSEDVSATYPEDGQSIASDNEEQIRYETQKLFAEKLVKYFYKHKEVIE